MSQRKNFDTIVRTRKLAVARKGINFGEKKGDKKAGKHRAASERAFQQNAGEGVERGEASRGGRGKKKSSRKEESPTSRDDLGQS